MLCSIFFWAAVVYTCLCMLVAAILLLTAEELDAKPVQMGILLWIATYVCHILGR